MLAKLGEQKKLIGVIVLVILAWFGGYYYCKSYIKNPQDQATTLQPSNPTGTITPFQALLHRECTLRQIDDPYSYIDIPLAALPFTFSTSLKDSYKIKNTLMCSSGMVSPTEAVKNYELFVYADAHQEASFTYIIISDRLSKMYGYVGPELTFANQYKKYLANNGNSKPNVFEPLPGVKTLVTLSLLYPGPSCPTETSQFKLTLLTYKSLDEYTILVLRDYSFKPTPELKAMFIKHATKQDNNYGRYRMCDTSAFDSEFFNTYFATYDSIPSQFKSLIDEDANSANSIQLK